MYKLRDMTWYRFVKYPPAPVLCSETRRIKSFVTPVYSVCDGLAMMYT